MPDPTRRPGARPTLVALEDRTTPSAALVLSNNTLIPIDTAFPTLPQATVPVTGLSAGENLVGIAVRPQNGHLYGLTYENQTEFHLYDIDYRTGAATPLTAGPVSLTVALPGAITVGGTPPSLGSAFGFSFDPTTDQARVVSDAGYNFRIDPNTGQIVNGSATAPGPNPDAMLNGGSDKADGTAFTNAVPNASVTTEYTLDASSDKLFVQNPPSAGTLTNPLPVTLNGSPLAFADAAGFAIPPGVAVSAAAAVAKGTGLAALTVAGQTGLYGLNLSTGQAALIGLVGAGTTPTQGLAVLPAAAGEVPLIGTDGKNLVRFDATAPGQVTTIPLTGVITGQTVVGVALRPTTGQFYGLGVDPSTGNGTLYQIDPQTGSATIIGPIADPIQGSQVPPREFVSFVDAAGKQIPLPAPAAGYGVGFDVTTDTVRVVTGTGLDFRVDPATGFSIDDNLGGATGSVPGTNPGPAIAGAATGAVAYAPPVTDGSTTGYALDAASGQLLRITPGTGATTAVGPVTLNGSPLAFSTVAGFAIPPAASAAAAPRTGYAALTVGGTTGLYAIDLATGAATSLGTIGGGTTPLAGLAVADTQPGLVPVRLYAVGTGPGVPAQVKVYNPDGQVRFTLTPYESSFTGGVQVATGDVNGDGVDDVITGTGVGGGPVVKVYDGATGQLIESFAAYEDSFRGGVQVAAGDVNGDGIADIVTGTGAGGGPRVRAFDGRTQAVLADFFAYESTFRGGVQVAVRGTASGHAGGPSGPDYTIPAAIVTGTGVGGGPRVEVFDAQTLTPVANFFAFEPSFRGGVTVAAGYAAAATPEIVAGTGPGGGPRVVTFTRSATFTGPGTVTGQETYSPAADFFAFDQSFRGGVQVAAADLSGTGVSDVVTGAGPGVPNEVRVYAADGTQLTDLHPFDATFTGGVFVG